jgi:hypothetical protein
VIFTKIFRALFWYIYWFGHLEVHPVIFYLKYAFHFRLWTYFITFMLLSTTKHVITFACSSDSVLLATCKLITRITKANHRAMSWLRRHVIAHVCPDHLECMELRLHALITWFLNKGVTFKYHCSIIHNQVVGKSDKSFEYVVNFKCLAATLIHPTSMREVKELTMFMECLTIRSIIFYLHICRLKINTQIYRTLLSLLHRAFPWFNHHELPTNAPNTLII